MHVQSLTRLCTGTVWSEYALLIEPSLAGFLKPCLILQHLVDAVLAVKKDKEPIDLHMVEIMEMQHKTDMDTT